MTEAQQLWEYQVQLRRIAEHRQQGIESNIRREYKQALQKLQAVIAKYYAAYGNSDDSTMTQGDLRSAGKYKNFLQDVVDHLNGITEPVDKQIRQVIEDTYTTCYNGMVSAVKQSASNTQLGSLLSGLSSVAPETVKNVVENPMRKLTLSTVLNRRRTQIISSTKKTLAVGLASGDSYTRMAQRIADTLDVDYKKAMRIVRTEANRAINRGFQDVTKEASEMLLGSDYIEVKEWCSMDDESVRSTHQHLNGKKIHALDVFESSGTSADCPGAFGVASEDINCRCFLMYSIMSREEFIAQGGVIPESVLQREAKLGLTSVDDCGIIKKSGALNHNSEDAYEHAERYYESVRKMKTDVKRISQSTGYSEKFIQQIKDFVFIEEHDLGENGVRRFYADYKIAQTWQRLIDGKNIKDHDMTFLKHEEMERELMQQGYSQEEAHNITSETYNYAKEAIKYYAEIEKHKKK